MVYIYPAGNALIALGVTSEGTGKQNTAGSTGSNCTVTNSNLQHEAQPTCIVARNFVRVRANIRYTSGTRYSTYLALESVPGIIFRFENLMT